MAINKRKINDEPLTYQIFEKLPKTDPIYLGLMTERRDGVFRWESSFGGSSGEGTSDTCLHMIHRCASRSDFVKALKKRGMQG